MGLFTGVGDFFRGAFGENDEEKKRRKQQEAQAVKVRQPQLTQPKVATTNQMSGDKTQPQASTPTSAPLQQSKPPVVVQPKAPTVKLPDQEFKGISTSDPKNKTIFGFNAAAFLPKSLEKTYTVKADRNVTTNKDKYVAEYDKLTPDFQKVLVNSAKEQAKKGDKAAITTLQALKDGGRLSGNVNDFAQGANERFIGGLTRGTLRTTDLLLPGKNTFGLERLADQQDAKKNNTNQVTKGGTAGEGFGTFEKGLVDLATIVIPQSKIDKLAEANAFYKTLADGSKIMKVGGKLVKVVPGSITGTATDYLQSRGRGDDPSLAKSTAIGVGTDLAVDAIPGGRIIKRLFKGKTAPSSVIDNAVEGTVGAATAGAAQVARLADNQVADTGIQSAERAIQEKGLQNAAEKDLLNVASDESNPAFKRKEAKNELARRSQAADQAAFDADPLNRPAYLAKQDAANIVKNEEDKLNAYVNANPNLTRQQLEIVQQAARDRVTKLVDALKNTREASLTAVTTEGKNLDTTVQAGQTAAGDAAAKQADQVAPAAKDIVQATPTSAAPETAANNAYQPTSYADDSTAVVEAIGQSGQTKRGNILYNNPLTKLFNKTQQGYIEKVDAGRDKIAAQGQKAIQSTNRFTKGAAEVPRMFFKNIGQGEAVRESLIKRTSHVQNAGKVAKAAFDSMENAVKAAGNPKQVYERIDRVLEDPEFLARIYGDGTKLTPNDLTPQERVAFDQLIKVNKIRNDINLKTGVIDSGQHAQFADGMHSPRIYDIPTDTGSGSSRYLDLKAGVKRKDVKDLPDYVLAQRLESPFQASALRLETALKNSANHEALANLDNAGGLVKSPPNNNFVQLTGKKYGTYDGMYIDKQVLSQIDGKDYYNSEVGQRTGDLINSFHGSILGAPGRAYKKFRTTLSPATFLGNVGSGQLAFSGASNINPVTSLFRTIQASKQLNSKGLDPYVQEAELAGLFSGDTGRQITNSKQVDSAVRKGKDSVYQKVQNVYGGVDKASALGWYNEFRARGLTAEQAVQRVHLGMQNYGNTGRAVNALSDAPILGKPFARFTPELLRIAKNSAIYNPVGTSAKAAGLYAGANALSDAAGETPEQRKAREEAPGQTKLNLPFTDKGVSLNVPVGDSSYNVARLVGLNFPQEPGGDPNSAFVRQLNPVADLTRKNAQGESVFAPNQVVGDMFYRQIADQIANRDFLGRDINDPTNKTYYEDGGASVKKLEGQPSDNNRLKNRLRALAMGLPFAPEADNLYNAFNKQDDYYGKTRTIPESLGRLFGVKVESNTPEARQKRTDKNDFFNGQLADVQKFVQDNPDLAQKYYQLKDPTRTRPTDANDPGSKVSDMISPEKWDVINSDTTGRLFAFMKDQSIKTAAKSVIDNQNDPSKPIRFVDPVYTLPDEEAKYVAELRSRPSGDDIEAQDILRATSTWYKDYETKYFDYLEKSSKNKPPTYPGAAEENARVKAYGDASARVEMPAIIDQYLKVKAVDANKAKEVYKANKDVLSAAFDTYAVQKLDRINKLRKIEGFEPISLEVYKNKTFGFNINDGSGFGGGSGSTYNPADHVNNFGNLTNFSKGLQHLDTLTAQTPPALASLFAKLDPGSGGQRQKPRIGASSSGR